MDFSSDDYAVYKSPFRSSIFKPSKQKTVRQEYRDRIKQMYDSIECNESQKKCKHAFELLDREYFGREHELYVLIFDKYNLKDTHALMDEYVPSSYSTPLISDLFATERESITCSECEQSLDATEFPADELQNNGYFLACARCAPDRNNVVSVKWHSNYKSQSVILENKGYIAKVMQSSHRYVIGDQRTVCEGIHCWRWCATRYQSWFLFGISQSKKYTDNSYGNQGVFGIAGSNQSYANGQCQYDIQTAAFFGKKIVLIDMLLDLNKGHLRFKIPGNNSEAKMKGIPIPKDNAQNKGYVPHANIHYANCAVQIKKIPPHWYGKTPKRVKFEF